MGNIGSDNFDVYILQIVLIMHIFRHMSGLSETGGGHGHFSAGHPYNYRQDSYSVASYGSPDQGDIRDYRYASASMSRMAGPERYVYNSLHGIS